MSSRDRLKIAFFITGKKVLAAKINLSLLLGFVILLGYIWQRDSFPLSLKAFLYFFPYLFLFLSQDMLKDEVDSGSLENVLFLDGNFRGYLLAKSLFLALAALSCSSVIFMVFAVFGLITKQFLAVYLLQFLAGIVAGIYYLSLGGLLSFSLRGGSNVLIVILGQVFLFIGLLLSARQKSGFLDALDGASFPDLASRLKFLVLAVVYPQVVVAKRFIIYGLGIALLGLFFLILERARIYKLELERK